MYQQRKVWEFDPINREQVYRTRRYKVKDVEHYQAQLTMLVRAARPSDFQPTDKVIVGYVLFVGRDVDSDNVMKACNDAVAKGLGIDDRRFICVTLDKFTGYKDPRMELAIFDANHHRVVVEPREE